MDGHSPNTRKRRREESESPPTKRQKIDEEMYSDETLEEDENSFYPNDMDEERASEIAKKLEKNEEVDLTGVKELILNEERRFRRAIHWNRLWDALKHNTTLTYLSAGHCYGNENMNPIYDGHCRRLSEALKENKTLEMLSLDANDFTSYGVELLAEGLKVNNKLDTLVLAYNNLDLRAFRALGEVLKVNTALGKLHVDSLDLLKGDLEDFLVFCDALKTNTTLHTLHFSGTTLYEDCYAALQEALKVNQGLETVSQPKVKARPKSRRKKQKAAEQVEAKNIEEAGVKAADNESKAEVLKSEDEQAKTPFPERSKRRAKLTAQANITPVVAKKTRKKRGQQENGVNGEAKNSNENQIQEEGVKAQNDASKDAIKEPITKKANNTKKAAADKKNNLNKGLGIVRRKQRRAKLFAQSMITPVMIRKTRKRKNKAENDNSDENSKSEEQSTIDSPTRLQRKAKLIAGANITPLMLRKRRNKQKSSEEETKNKNNTNTKANKNIKEVKSTKPRKYIKKKDVKPDDLSTNNTPQKLAIKVPPNQRRAKYFARATITPLMLRKTRKRRKTAKNETKESDIEEIGMKRKQRRAKLVARRSITPLVLKKTRKRRKSEEESNGADSPSNKEQEEQVKRGPGRPSKKKRVKSESTSGSSQDVKANKIAVFQPKKKPFKFVVPYQPRRKERPQRLAKNEN